MWSVVSRTSQNGQFGVSVFSITCRWVALVYPVLRRDMIIFSFLLSSAVSFCQLADVFRFLISLSPLSHLCCLCMASSFFIHFIRSWGGQVSRLPISSVKASFAAKSAASFPLISTWLGTHIRLIWLPELSISFLMIRVFGFLVLLFPDAANSVRFASLCSVF
jgi:hypothetical protein